MYKFACDCFWGYFPILYVVGNRIIIMTTCLDNVIELC